MTIIELLTSKKSYIADVKLSNGYSLFFEGLQIGCSILDDEFNEDKIESILCELIDPKGEAIDTYEVRFEDDIEELKAKVEEDLQKWLK